MRITTLFIGLIIGSVFMVVCWGLISNINDNYNLGTGKLDLTGYNKIDNLSQSIQDIRTNTTTIKNRGLVDVIGGYFVSAYNVLMITPRAVDSTIDIASQATTDASGGLGSSATLFKTALILIIIVIVFLGIILSAVLKSDV